MAKPYIWRGAYPIFPRSVTYPFYKSPSFRVGNMFSTSRRLSDFFMSETSLTVLGFVGKKALNILFMAKKAVCKWNLFSQFFLASDAVNVCVGVCAESMHRLSINFAADERGFNLAYVALYDKYQRSIENTSYPDFSLTIDCPSAILLAWPILPHHVIPNGAN